MNFTNWIKSLEKRKIISKKPHPIIPFILGIIALFLGFISQKYNNFIYLFSALIFIFAIIHLIVVIILEKKRV